MLPLHGPVRARSLLVLSAILLLVGCSGGGGGNNVVPTTPVVDPTRSTFGVDKTTVTADGIAKATFSATVVDQNGLDVPNCQVLISASGSGNVVVQMGPTDANGNTTGGTLQSTVAEAK